MSDEVKLTPGKLAELKAKARHYLVYTKRPEQFICDAETVLALIERVEKVELALKRILEHRPDDWDLRQHIDAALSEGPNETKG